MNYPKLVPGQESKLGRITGRQAETSRVADKTASSLLLFSLTLATGTRKPGKIIATDECNSKSSRQIQL